MLTRRPSTRIECIASWIGWRLRGLLALVLVAGCAAPLRVLRFHDRDIIIADDAVVNAFCSATAGKWDDGSYKPKGAPASGCYQKNPTIWMKEAPNAGLYLHENRHHDCRVYSKNKNCGKNPEKEGYK